MTFLCATCSSEAVFPHALTPMAQHWGPKDSDSNVTKTHYLQKLMQKVFCC